METKLSKIQEDKRNIEEQIQFAAKGKIDIFLMSILVNPKFFNPKFF